MKPVIIYSLPRCRSTAALQACKKPVKYNEPFDLNTLWNSSIWQSQIRSVLYGGLDSRFYNALFANLNSDQAVSKFFGASLYHCLPARKWWNEVLTAGTHQIFVLNRNLTEVFLSYLLAKHFGFTHTSIDSKIIKVSKSEFYMVEYHLDSFLRFFPKEGTVVEYQDLPVDLFDKSSVSLIAQHSATRYSDIENLDEVKENIQKIVDYYRKDIEAVMPIL